VGPYYSSSVVEEQTKSIHDNDLVVFFLKVVNGGEVRIDSKYIDDKKELYTAVYPTHDLMGWYSVGEEVLPTDLQIHQAMMAWNESPLFLLLVRQTSHLLV